MINKVSEEKITVLWEEEEAEAEAASSKFEQ